jgi:hypothetical protein
MTIETLRIVLYFLAAMIALGVLVEFNNSETKL